MKRVLLTGGTGLLGKKLGIALATQGIEIAVVVRNLKSSEGSGVNARIPFPHLAVDWEGNWGNLDALNGRALSEWIAGIDAVIHLAGEPIASQAWTDAVKKRLVSSRVESTEALVKWVSGTLGVTPRVWINGSAIGIYGDRGDELLTETSASGTGFLAELCRDWESALKLTKKTRVVFLRTGIVLSPRGGALAELHGIFAKGIGSPLAGGRQWMSWIHEEDWVRLVLRCLEDESIEGAVNAVAPGAETNREFSKKLAKVMGVRLLPSVPRLVLKSVLGERATVLLESQRVEPTHALQAGFQFKWPELNGALQDLLGETGQASASRFHCWTYLPYPIDKVFPFFSQAKNLEEITPPWLEFKILQVSTQNMERGTLIDYRLKLYGVPFQWRTLIDRWEPPHVFVDTQLKGPYELWHHTHSFQPLVNPLGVGTLMEDQVLYRAPLGKLGLLTAGWKVDQEVKRIFDYRQEVIQKRSF